MSSREGARPTRHFRGRDRSRRATERSSARDDTFTSHRFDASDMSRAGLTPSARKAMEDALDSRGLSFDVIYADPPYRAGLYGTLARLISNGGWLRTGGTMLWECASDHVPEVPPGWKSLGLRRYGGSSVLLLTQAVVDPRPSRVSG